MRVVATQQYVRRWIREERSYTYGKFGGEEVDDVHTQEFADAGRDETWWHRQLLTYLDRAHILGLDTPAGRQAAAKFTTTAVMFLESTIRTYGEVPEPGVPSGENLDRLAPLKR